MLLEHTPFLDEQADGGWHLHYFEVLDEIMMINLECCFEQGDVFHEHAALYRAETGDDCEGIVFVREVPATLVFTCGLAIHQEARAFEAVYTTMAGSVVTRLRDTLQGVLTMEHRLNHSMETVRANGVVPSRNQHVRLVMSSNAPELPPESVLRREPLPLMEF